MDSAIEPTEEQEQRPSGPGIVAKEGLDPTVITAWVFVMLGFTPSILWRTVLGFDYFGPIEVSAILTMVGVLFGFIAVLRSIDLRDLRLRWAGGVALALGMIRLFLAPFF